MKLGTKVFLTEPLADEKMISYEIAAVHCSQEANDKRRPHCDVLFQGSQVSRIVSIHFTYPLTQPLQQISGERLQNILVDTGSQASLLLAGARGTELISNLGMLLNCLANKWLSILRGEISIMWQYLAFLVRLLMGIIAFNLERGTLFLLCLHQMKFPIPVSLACQ